jgi:chromosome segregation ATPase
MRSNETELRLRRFEVNEKQDQIADIEAMIFDFKRLVDDLGHQIRVEEETSRISDVNHHSYPTYAKAARQRRDNLNASIEELEAKLVQARADLEESLEELKKSELLEERSLINNERSGTRHGTLAAENGVARPHIYGD